jgi:phytoene synthase
MTTMRPPWDEAFWSQFENTTRSEALRLEDDGAAWLAVARKSRLVLRTYSTSFFLVTRFLPPVKRARVEVIYAAVRFPDEVVDSFPLAPQDKLAVLNRWAAWYDKALQIGTVRERLRQGVPPILAAFAQVVLDCSIPVEHYHSFLEAMRRDASPQPFATLDHLVDDYIYGSAIVVGYFLAYVYGPSAPGEFERALRASRALGIALQLTNFLRDVGEDQRRGRVYLPENLLRRENIEELNVQDSAQLPALRRVMQILSAAAEQEYRAAELDMNAFAPDCRVAIQACIDVYRLLNRRIGRSAEGVRHRESVPMSAKFQALPPSKYWRLPLAYLGAL